MSGRPQTYDQTMGIADTISTLQRAAEHLVAQRHCTATEAQEWIQHEARAKRTSLEEVAQAVVAGRAIPYRPNVPI